MKLQRSTWILMVIAIALGGGILLYESQQGENTEQAQGVSLYPFEESDVQQFKINRADATLAFEKTDEGNWQMTAPKKQLAEVGAIAFLLDQMTGKPTIETLTVVADDLPKFGLDSPPATVALTLADGSTHQLQVGGTDFSGDNLYVRLIDDTEAVEHSEDITLYLVSGGLSNGVERPVEEWLIADETVEPEGAEGVEGDGEDGEAEGAEGAEGEAEGAEGAEGEAEGAEVSEPEVSEPEASEPETSESEAAEPETSEPDNAL